LSRTPKTSAPQRPEEVAKPKQWSSSTQPKGFTFDNDPNREYYKYRHES
jgi:hypothetical protein